MFHADEVFAVAVLKLYFQKENKQIEIIRTRDQKIISQCDIAVDVGDEYGKTRKRFDHHQKKKPKNRKNNIPYASFGLVWRHFGNKLTSSKKVHLSVEKKLVMPIDALDNGVLVSNPIFEGVYEFGAWQIVSAINMAYKENEIEIAFEKALEFATLVITGEITRSEAKIEGEKTVTKEIIKQNKPKILVLEKYTNWELAVSKYKEIKFVIFPDKIPTRWCIQTARDNLQVFGQDRISFPLHWRGLSDQELANVTNVIGSVFCHMGGFYAVAKTRLSAIDLATKALNHKERHT